MAKFEVEQIGENRLLARLDSLPRQMREKLVPVINRITDEMLQRVLAAEPQRTGALKAATQRFVDNRAHLLRGRVRVLREPGQKTDHNIKAAALEYGAHGNAQVGAHEMSLDHVFDTPIDPEQVMVAAYNRDVNITADRFLRDALIGLQAEFEIEVERAIAELTL